MKLFLDTSALIKLYQKKADSHNVEDLLGLYEIETIVLSAIAKVEFASALWKKLRTKELELLQVEGLLISFQDDISKYEFVPVDNAILEKAASLLRKYGAQGLRSLDSIQLASALSVRNTTALFKSMDKLLDSFFQNESLRTS